MATILFAGCIGSEAETLEICTYRDKEGRVLQVKGRQGVPLNFRNKARCQLVGQNHFLAKPEEIEISGLIRREDMTSSVGRIELRWPRSVEKLFGRTPVRAMADAARTVSRLLKSGGFDERVRNLDLKWSVVFLDEDLPETQIPAYLIHSCHPAWMTPPASLYFIAQRIATHCGQKQNLPGDVADARLAQVILHEMGHAVEYQLLSGGNQVGYDRMRAEGFATWFEQYGARYSSIISESTVRAEHRVRAQESYREKSGENFIFRGSATDYSRAGLYFDAVVERRGVLGLMQIYHELNRNGGDFFIATEVSLGWGRARLEREAQRLLR